MDTNKWYAPLVYYTTPHHTGTIPAPHRHHTSMCTITACTSSVSLQTHPPHFLPSSLPPPPHFLPLLLPPFLPYSLPLLLPHFLPLLTSFPSSLPPPPPLLLSPPPGPVSCRVLVGCGSVHNPGFPSPAMHISSYLTQSTRSITCLVVTLATNSSATNRR